MDISKIFVDTADIIAQMESLNAEMRRPAVPAGSPMELAHAYDLGVHNAMCALEAIICDGGMNRNKLIYNRMGHSQDEDKYTKLENALKEMESTGDLLTDGNDIWEALRLIEAQRERRC